MTYIFIERSTNIQFFCFGVEVWVTTSMTSNNKLSKQFVCNRVNRVLDDTKNIKTGQNWLSQLDILLERNCWVVSTTDRIGRCDNRATCL